MRATIDSRPRPNAGRRSPEPDASGPEPSARPTIADASAPPTPTALVGTAANHSIATPRVAITPHTTAEGGRQ